MIAHSTKNTNGIDKKRLLAIFDGFNVSHCIFMEVGFSTW